MTQNQPPKSPKWGTLTLLATQLGLKHCKPPIWGIEITRMKISY